MMPRGLLFVAMVRSCAGIAVKETDVPIVVEDETAREAYWPQKGGNIFRSGTSEYSAPTDMTTPTWSFEEPKRDERGNRSNNIRVFHTSPVIDADKNSYVLSTTGWIYSLDPEGKLRWEFEMTGTNPGNPVLYKGLLFAACSDGGVYALKADTGSLMWRRQAGASNPSDTYSLLATDHMLIVPTNKFERPDMGNTHLVALRTTDGHVMWEFALTSNGKPRIAYNMMPAVFYKDLVFSDSTGGLYRIKLEDRSLVWHKPGWNPLSFTTGGSIVGDNGVFYITHNMMPGRGVVRAHDAETGALLWHKFFEQEVNAAPATGVLGPNGERGVVVLVGNNDNMKFGTVYALDAFHGTRFWSFKTPMRLNKTIEGWNEDDRCYPDHWGNPLVMQDGTVHVNWSGGKVFAIRDEDKNGMISANEVSSHHHGFGTNGQTASAPGMLVVPSCNRIMGFVKPRKSNHM